MLTVKAAFTGRTAVVSLTGQSESRSEAQDGSRTRWPKSSFLTGCFIFMRWRDWSDGTHKECVEVCCILRPPSLQPGLTHTNMLSAGVVLTAEQHTSEVVPATTVRTLTFRVPHDSCHHILPAFVWTCLLVWTHGFYNGAQAAIELGVFLPHPPRS